MYIIQIYFWPTWFIGANMFIVANMFVVANILVAHF